MDKKGRVRYVLASSNTARGFRTFIPHLLTGLQKVYILKGAAGSGKSTFIRMIGDALYEQGYEVEFWVSVTDPLNPEGVYIPQLETALVNGSLPQPVDPKYPGIVEEIINLGDYHNRELLDSQRLEIMELTDQIDLGRKMVDKTLGQAEQVRTEIKKVASVCFNLKKIQDLINQLAEEILSRRPTEKHYFASAVTAEGMINYIDEISSNCQKRYILKGPAGSGKSTVIQELASILREKGFALEYYHNGLDYDSLDMLIICNLQIAFLDAGNFDFKTKPGDVVVDMLTYLDKYENEPTDIIHCESFRNYERLLVEAQLQLENVQELVKQLKRIYSRAMDFNSLDQKREALRKELQYVNNIK